MRSVGSSLADPYLSVAAAAAALSGLLHGGANEEVLKMLDEIGTKDNVPAYIRRVKDGHGKLMGFGHRVYKNFDPRATIIKQVADEVFEVTGNSPRLEIALELERIALEDEYFIKRKLYPNVDFYSGIIYQAVGFKPEMFTVALCHPAHSRLAGAVAGDADGHGAEDCPTTTDLYRAALTPLPSDKRAPSGRPGWGIASSVFEPGSKSQMNGQLKKEEEKSNQK